MQFGVKKVMSQVGETCYVIQWDQWAQQLEAYGKVFDVLYQFFLHGNEKHGILLWIIVKLVFVGHGIYWKNSRIGIRVLIVPPSHNNMRLQPICPHPKVVSAAI